MAFNFNPTTGLLDLNAFPSEPTTEAEARQQFMTLFNQLKDYINSNMVQDIKQSIYAIGDIITTTVNVNPAGRFGGTWVEFGKGKTLVGVDKNDTDFNVAEKIGGYKTQPLRALIGATDSDLSKIGYQAGARVPTHDYNRGISGSAFGGAINSAINHSTVVKRDDGTEPTTLQPYVTVYFWKKTA